MSATPRDAAPSYGPALVHEGTGSAEVLHVYGELDFISAPQFESALVKTIRIGKPLIVDLSECTFIDAAIVSVLVRARRALGDRFRVIACANGNPSRVLHLTGFDHRTPCETPFEMPPRPAAEVLNFRTTRR